MRLKQHKGWWMYMVASNWTVRGIAEAWEKESNRELSSLLAYVRDN